MVLHALFGIAQHPVVDSEQFPGLDGEPGFLACFPDGRLAYQFADLEHASGNRPLRLQRRVRALDQNNPSPVDDNCAHSHQRHFRKFALHTWGSMRRENFTAWRPRPLPLTLLLPLTLILILLLTLTLPLLLPLTLCSLACPNPVMVLALSLR